MVTLLLTLQPFRKVGSDSHSAVPPYTLFILTSSPLQECLGLPKDTRREKEVMKEIEEDRKGDDSRETRSEVERGGGNGMKRRRSSRGGVR